MTTLSKTRIRKAEKTLEVCGGRPGCPPFAMGHRVGQGLYEIGGKVYDEATIARCFPRHPFVVLDDGPTRAGEVGE